MKISISRRDAIVAACLAGIAAWAVPSQAAPMSFKVALTGAQQVPPVQTAATGTADLIYDPATRMLTWNVTYNGLSGPATMAHFHGPAAEGKNAPPVVWLIEKGIAVSSPMKGQATLTPEQAQQLMAGEWYINVHTQANANGEIRGQIMPPKS
jgi:hypothetical protein